MDDQENERGENGNVTDEEGRRDNGETKVKRRRIGGLAGKMAKEGLRRSHTEKIDDDDGTEAGLLMKPDDFGHQESLRSGR